MRGEDKISSAGCCIDAKVRMHGDPLANARVPAATPL